MELTLILFIIFSIAFLYASVGHGGASGYLGFMVLLGFSQQVMKPSALLLNIIVSSIAAIQFYRSGYFKRKLFIPFIILSIPMAFIGAKIPLNDHIYRILLGFCLIFSVIRLFLFDHFIPVANTQSPPLIPALFAGALIGLISGMIGIGGGILLSPVLLIFNWANMKETAAISAPFIAVNSLAGMAGLIGSDVTFSGPVWFWLAAAVAGGLIGAYWGSKKLNSFTLRYILAFVMVIASVKLFIS